MTDNRGDNSRGNFGERSLRSLRDLHIGIGAVALVGTAVFPELAVVAVYEALNALAHEAVRQVVKSPPNQKPQPQSA